MIDWKQYIERDPLIMMGKPVFRNTRITVEFILERLAEGATAVELLTNYEGLLPDHLRAALSYAASAIRHEELIVPT